MRSIDGTGSAAARQGADLKLHWLPRLQNEEADSLTNGEYSRIDSKRRVRFDLRSFERVTQDLLCAGMDLYEEVRNPRARKSALSRSKQPRQAALRVTDPANEKGRAGRLLCESGYFSVSVRLMHRLSALRLMLHVG